MKRIILIIGILGLCGCGTLNFPLLNAPKPPEQIYKYHQTISTEPRVVQTDSKGHSVVFTAETQTVDVNYDDKQKPLSWWQKVCNWLSGLSFMAIVALIVMLFVAPAGTMAWLVNEYNKFKTAFTQTVQGIEKGGGVATAPAIAAGLSSTQSPAVKAMVDDVQQPGT